MSKYLQKKRSIPHETSVDGIRKYFKPLNEISNQLLSSSSETEPVDVNNIPTKDSSELSFSLASISPIINRMSHLSVNNKEMALCTSFKNISTTSTNSILSTKSNQSILTPQSHIDIQSSDTPEYDQTNRKSFSL